MKVLLINGSPRANGNTARALKEVADTLAAEGIETETVWIGKKAVRGCIACFQCMQKSLGRCIFDDDIANRIVEKLPSADAFVVWGAHLLRPAQRRVSCRMAARLRRGTSACRR